MPKYIVHNAQGAILRILDVPEQDLEIQIGAGEAAMDAGDATPFDSVDVATGAIIRQAAPLVPVPDETTIKRLGAYPTIADQLDMLWHAMDEGEIPKATRFYNAILAVKAALPHDGSGNDAATVQSVDAIPAP